MIKFCHNIRRIHRQTQFQKQDQYETEWHPWGKAFEFLALLSYTYTKWGRKDSG